jgi:hypothetical protein
LEILLAPYPDHLVGNYLDGRLGEFSRIQPAQKSALVYTDGLSDLESGEGFDNAYYKRYRKKVSIGIGTNPRKIAG